MNTKKKTIKNILCYMASLALLLISSIGLLKISNTSKSVYAAEDNMLPVTISNSNFDENTKTTFPYDPNNFNAYNGDTKVSSSDSVQGNVEAGVIKLSNEKYTNKFTNARRSSNLDDYVLMIESKANANYGYRTSKAVTLEKNSNYMLSVDVYTENNAGIASLFLYNEDGSIFSSMKNQNAYRSWTPYTFFVSTSDSAKTVNLGMYLQGTGTVLFDNIGCYQINDKQMEMLKTENFAYENLNDNILKEYVISGNDFVNAKNPSDIQPITPSGNANVQTITNSDGKNDLALLVEANSSAVKLSTENDFLTFKQNMLYKVSVSLKTEELSGNANLQLIQTDVDTKDAKNSDTIKITSNSNSQSVTNGYTQYSFFINSNPTKDSTYKLVFGLGDDETKTSGKLYVSSVVVSKINYSTFNGATGANEKKLDLTSGTIYSSNPIMLDNGNFNGIQIADYNKPFPATPANWTVTLGKNTQSCGVINTNSENFATLSSLGLFNLQNPNPSENQNVLMMHNATNDTLSYTSATKSLTENTYHKFEIDVQTINAPITLSLVTTIDGKEIVLTSIDVETNSQSYKTVSLYVHTGNRDLSVSLKATLTTTNGYGYAFLDNAKFDYLVAPTQEDFDLVANSSTTAVVDLSNILDTNETAQWAKPKFFTSDTTGTFGIIDKNGENLLSQVVADPSNLEMFKTVNDSKILGIRINKSNAIVKSSLGYDLTSGKFYQVSFKVYTQLLSSNSDGEFGAGIKLSNYDKNFTNIVSNNAWTEYSFVIKADSDTTSYLEFSLGNSDIEVSGDVFFGDITFKTIEESEFNTLPETANRLVLNKVSEENKDDNEETPAEEQKQEKDNTVLWYVIPNLIFVVAIALAIVGVMIRKIKWKKPTRKRKNEYDRNKTVSKQVYMRKAVVVREKKIHDLNKELEEVHAQREKYEEEYKQNLTKLRQLKIKRAPQTEIAKLEKEIKRNQRATSNIGITVNRLQSEIQYIKTDAYLNSLMKRLAHEQQNTSADSEEEK